MPPPRTTRRTRRLRRIAVAVALLGVAGGRPTFAQGTARVSADQWVVSDGVWLRYRVVGARGPVVLMLHGSSDRADPLLPLARTLGTGRRVVLLDQRGFGMSGKPVDAAQYGTALVDDVVSVLDGVGADRVDVVAHGAAALVATKLAALHPGRVRRLVLVGGPVYRDRARLPRLLAPTIAALGRATGGGPPVRTLATVAADPGTSRASDPAALRAYDRRALLAAAQSFPSLFVDAAEVRALRVPVLAVAGSRDPLADAARELPAWWPGATTALLDGATHDGVLGDARLAARVRQFLDAR